MPTERPMVYLNETLFFFPLRSMRLSRVTELESDGEIQMTWVCLPLLRTLPAGCPNIWQAFNLRSTWVLYFLLSKLWSVQLFSIMIDSFLLSGVSYNVCIIYLWKIEQLSVSLLLCCLTGYKVIMGNIKFTTLPYLLHMPPCSQASHAVHDHDNMPLSLRFTSGNTSGTTCLQLYHHQLLLKRNAFIKISFLKWPE